MRRVLKAAGYLLLVAAVLPIGQAAAQTPGNPSQAWGGIYRNPGFIEQTLRDQKALILNGLEQNGPAGVGGGAGGGGVTNYNGTVNNTYNGPVTSSGPSATSVGNLSTVEVSGSPGASVGVGQGNQQGTQATGATSASSQNGPASASGSVK